jgi:hypothetical protein
VGRLIHEFALENLCHFLLDLCSLFVRRCFGLDVLIIPPNPNSTPFYTLRISKLFRMLVVFCFVHLRNISPIAVVRTFERGCSMFQSRDDGSKSNLHLVFLVLIEFLKRLICKKRLALTTLHPPPPIASWVHIYVCFKHSSSYFSYDLFYL